MRTQHKHGGDHQSTVKRAIQPANVISGRYLKNLLNLSSLHSNVQHLATTLSGHSPSLVADALYQQPTHLSYSQHEPRLDVSIGTSRSSVARALQLHGQAYISRGWAASHLQLNSAQAQSAFPCDENLPLLDREETGPPPASLFEDFAQPELHGTGSIAPQLVTIVITIHDDALQQALDQAQRDLQAAQAQAAQLQMQAETLRAELQKPASSSASTMTMAAAADQPQDAPTDSSTNSADVSCDAHQLQEQLRSALQQAESAAAQHATVVATMEELRRQLSQQGSGLTEEERANQVLRTDLQAAQAIVAETSGTVQLLRAEALTAAQRLQTAQSEAAEVCVARAQLQSKLSAVEAQGQQSQAQLAQAEQLVQQLQGLVQQLRTELADARQETSIASEALTASTELAGRLQAHVEIAQEQGAAAVQRVMHEHSRATADLEQRLQQATAALQRSIATAAAEEAEQRGSIQALQQRLEVAIAQSNAAVCKNVELADTVAQLELAQSSMTVQAAAATETVARMQAEVDTLHDHLTTANQAAARAATTEAAEGATAAGVGSALHQAAARHAEEVCDLQQKLETAETALQSMTADDAVGEADRRQAVQALQQQLAEVVEQLLVAQGQVFGSAKSIAELELQMAAAQAALQQQAESNGSAVQELESQVTMLQQQLVDANQAVATSAGNAAALLERSTAAEASCRQSEAARQQQAMQQSQIVQSLQVRLHDAQAALQQSAQLAAQTDTERQHSIRDLQQRLASALELASTSHDQQSQLKQECQSLADELAAAQAAVIATQQHHQAATCELQHQVAALRQQHEVAKKAAERRAASAEASAWEAANKLQAAAVEKGQLRQLQEVQCQAAQLALQEALSSKATALVEAQQEVQDLQQRLDGAVQESSDAQAGNAQLLDSTLQLKSQLRDAQITLIHQSDSNAAAISQLHNQVEILRQQLADIKQEAQEAAAEAASVQQAASTAERSHEALSAVLQQSIIDKTQAASILEEKLSAAQVALQQANNLAAVEAANHQQHVDNIQTKLDVSIEQSTAAQALNSQWADVIQQLRIQLQYSRNAMAKQIEANDEAVTDLHKQVESLQQQLDSVRQGAAAAVEEAAVAMTTAVSHQAAAAVLQEAAAKQDAVICRLQSSLHAAQTELQEATAAAEASQAKDQQSMQMLQQCLQDAQQPSQETESESNAQLSASVQHLTQQSDAARDAAVHEAETNKQAVAELQTQAITVQKQLDAALQAARSAAANAAAGASVQEAAALLQHSFAAKDVECHALEQELQSTQAALDHAAAAAHTDAHGQQELQSLHLELDGARAEASASGTNSVQAADEVKQLQAQLKSAQSAHSAQSAASAAQITQLQQQVGSLQHKLTTAKQAADAAAAENAVLSQQARAAEASHLAEAATLQQKAEDQTHLVHSLTQQVQAAQAQLQQATASAAAAHQQDRSSLEALQHRLEEAQEGSSGLQGHNSELAGRLAQGTSELESARTTLARQSAASLISLSQLQSQVQGLQAQLSAAKQTHAQVEEDRPHTINSDAEESADQVRVHVAHQQGFRPGPTASSASQTAAEGEDEAAEPSSAAAVLKLQLSSLSYEIVDLQHAVHAAQLDQAAAQQSEAMMRSRCDSLQLQVNLLQEDVACSGRQAEAAQQNSDDWQQMVHHLRAELDREKRAAEVDGMLAEVLLAKQEIDKLRETVQRLRQHRNPGPPQSLTTQPPLDALNTADAAYPTLTHQQSQAIASPSTPSHTPWVNPSTRSIDSSHTNASGAKGLSSVTGLHALVCESDNKDDQVGGDNEGALYPLLLEAQNVMTNPMFGMEGQGMSVPATPTTTIAPHLLQAVALQQAGHDRLAGVQQQLQEALERLAITRLQLYEAEEQGSALKEQQEGAEDLVRALRQELHNLRQDTNNVAANARQTVSEKEALKATLVAAQEAMMTQAEVMRQVTEERDMLHERLSHYTQPLARSNTAGAAGSGWIAAAYGTDSRPAQPLNGALSLPKKVKNRSSVSSNTSESSSPRHMKNRASVSSNTSESSSPRRKWIL